MNEKAKPVTVVLIENTAVDGKHLPKGHIIEDCDADLAVTLAGAGKARVATAEDLASAKKKGGKEDKGEKGEK